MALNKSSNNYLRHAMVKHHSIILESKQPEPGFEPRDIPDPRKKKPDGTFETVKKYINAFQSLDGLIRKIEWYDTGNRFSIRYLGILLYIEDLSSMKTVILDLPLKTGYYDQFTKQMENIDYTRPVSFEVWHDKSDMEKKPNRTAFKVSQDGAPIKWKYTREHPDGMPQPKQTLTGWDYGEQKAWLHEKLTNIVMVKVNEELNSKWVPDYHELCYPAGSGPLSDDELEYSGPPVADTQWEHPSVAAAATSGPLTPAVPTVPQPLQQYDDDIPF